jgi:GTP pyrophosphokinase
VIVKTVEECYLALAMVHSEWRAIPGQFDDYISSPKLNRYQSVHTVVMGPGGMPFEVQIRTEEMHRESEYGVAAHWRYKEGHLVQEDFDEKLSWIRQVLEWQEDLETAAPLVDILKGEIFSDQVFVFSPKGDVIDLPTGATPLDFAYRIHTEVGHHCIGAKVNERLVPLEYELRNGDRVQILTSKGSRGPSRDWLTIVRTGHARDKVRQWFKRQERAENEDYGKLVLDNELRRLGNRGLARVDQKALEGVAERLSFSDVSGLFAAIGYGAVTATQVINRLGLDAQEQADEADDIQEIAASEEDIGEQVQPPVNVMGTGDLFTRLGNCCNPIPGDSIIGFITRGRGVTVHNSACPNVANVSEPERLVQVSWGGQTLRNSGGLPSRLAPCCMPTWGSKIVGERVGGEAVVHLASCPQISTNGVERIDVSWGEETHTRLPVTLRLTAADREGLLRDVAGVVAEEGYSITSASVSTSADGVALLKVNLELANINELTRLLNRLQSIRNVFSARREAPGPHRN